jgi:hypothetical protein
MRDLVRGGSFDALRSIIGSNTTLGLYQGTLYDVLDANTGTGNATVNAIGFDITCGYLTDGPLSITGSNSSWIQNPWYLPLNYSEDILAIEIPYSGKIVECFQASAIPDMVTEPGVISRPSVDAGVTPRENSGFFYSTIPILDSSGTAGPWINLDSPMGDTSSTFTVFRVQVFQCFHTLIPQKAVVDTRSGQLIALESNIEKNTSSWVPYAGPTSTKWNGTSGTALLDEVCGILI